MGTVNLHTEELRAAASGLRAGDRLRLSGVVHTARDAAHKRLYALLDAGETLPFPLRDGVLYYAGATPAPDGLPIGACGPTTSGRMDPYTPRLHDLGLCATIGKGIRSPAVRQAVMRNGALYLCALGGAGALAAQCVTACEVIAFDDLGCEAIRRLTLREFPLIVGLDPHGGDIYSR